MGRTSRLILLECVSNPPIDEDYASSLSFQYIQELFLHTLCGDFCLLSYVRKFLHQQALGQGDVESCCPSCFGGQSAN